MQTRQEIYSHEASDLLRTVTMYRSLYEDQIYHLYPGKEKIIKKLLEYLVRQGRIYHNPENGRYSASTECDSRPDHSMIAAFWILLDFIDKVEYHSVSDFPVKISFFASGELYDIVHVTLGRELLMNHALSEKGESPSRRIILIDKQEQIWSLKIPNMAGFCMVNSDGCVNYFKPVQNEVQQ